VDSLEFTYARAFKVLWGFLWRSTLLMLPMMFVMPLMTFSMLPTEFMANPELMLQPASWLAVASRFMFGSTVLLVVTLALQVVAMRWTLNSAWSDFRLRAVPLLDQQRPEA
jgi:prepilin signal peptidase PulO-like enzyme (type II secretory pathway)